MMPKKILFISGSIGLGHVTRDIAVAEEIRRQIPGAEISWIASDPARRYLEDKGERLHAAAREWADTTSMAEMISKGGNLNLAKMAVTFRKAWAQNAELFKRVVKEEQFDIVIGDETYEISTAVKEDRGICPVPYAVIYDFVGFRPMTSSLSERLVTYIWNRRWAKDFDRDPYPIDLIMFVGEMEDIPDRRFGFMLPRLRDYARAQCKFIGHILQFDPAEYTDRIKVREQLGYGQDPLIICSVGGTNVGRGLIELCGEAYPLVKKGIPGVRMVMVCGPRIDPGSLIMPKGIDVKGYVPALYEHLAACDLAVIQGGATTSMELVALNRPFLYFPLEGHFEQQVHVSEKLARYGAGIRMKQPETTAESLAGQILKNIGKEVDCKPIPVNGAAKAADLIKGLVQR